MTVIDPMGAPEFFFSGVTDAEDIGGGCVRLTMFVNNKIGGSQEQVAVVKLICSRESIAPLIFKAAKAAGMTWHGEMPTMSVN